jgi:hypothetical protein
LSERFLVHEPNLILQVVGQRVRVAVEDEAGDAPIANSTAVIANDMKMQVP